MENNETSWISAGLSESYSLDLNTIIVNPLANYIFTPAGVTAKRVLCVILSATGTVGFLGNSLIFFFLWKKKSKNPIQSTRFMKNLNIYVRSLPLSDLLCCAVSLPLLCIQISFDVFQSGWQYRIVRYFNFIFPVITINNLVVTSLEKYLSTRTVSRTFSFSAVRKMIICVWVLGLVVSLFPSVAYDGIRLDLNNTHFTVVCKYRKNFYPVGAGLIFYPIQYVLPSIFITYTNVCLLKIVWNRGRRRIGNVTDNAFKAYLQAKS